MALTSRCPENKTEVQEASKRIGCGVDDYGNIQYMCIPNEEKSSLVEFCFNGVMGIEKKGNCLENSNGKINRYNCSSFTSGCPNTTFYKHNLYEYPACLEINTKNRCYVMDPFCPSQVPNMGQPDDTENHTGIQIGILIVIFTIMSLMFVAVVYFIRRNILCIRNRTLRKDIIVVDKLEGPAAYKFISKAQQKTSEQSSSLKRFIVQSELTGKHTILKEDLM